MTAPPATPVVSIALAMYNSGPTILHALRSLCVQTRRDWELILLDDGSTDDSVRLAGFMRDARIRLLVDGRRLGLAARLNQAVALARGRFVARMDADDIAYPQRLERQVDFLERHAEVDLVGTGALVFGKEGKPIGLFPVRALHEQICASPWEGFPLAHPTWMARRMWFQRFGYRDNVRRAQDQDLLLRAHRASRFACLPEVLLGYRQARISAGHILRGRYRYAVELCRYGAQERDWGLAVKGVCTQAFRGTLGALAVLLGQHQRLLRGRYEPPLAQQIEEWERCWKAVGRPLAEESG